MTIPEFKIRIFWVSKYSDLLIKDDKETVLPFKVKWFWIYSQDVLLFNGETSSNETLTLYHPGSNSFIWSFDLPTEVRINSVFCKFPIFYGIGTVEMV